MTYKVWQFTTIKDIRKKAMPTYLQCNGNDSILEFSHPRPKFFKPSLQFTTAVKLSFLIQATRIQANYTNKLRKMMLKINLFER